jgi:hypothetical protein
VQLLHALLPPLGPLRQHVRCVTEERSIHAKLFRSMLAFLQIMQGWDRKDKGSTGHGHAHCPVTSLRAEMSASMMPAAASRGLSQPASVSPSVLSPAYHMRLCNQPKQAAMHNDNAGGMSMSA